MNLLALGGIGALFATGWSQIKMIGEKLVSIIIIKAKIDNNISSQLRMYLLNNFKEVKLGFYDYVSLNSPLKSLNNLYSIIPFKFPQNQYLFYKNRKFLLAKITPNGLELFTLRGFFDIDYLITESIKYWNQEITIKESGESDRYGIYDIYGSEKNMAAALGSDRNYPSGGGTGGSVNPFPSNGSDSQTVSKREFIRHYDKSFAFSEEDYRFVDQKVNPLGHLYFEPEIEKYIQQAKKWIKLRKWYNDRSIPWKRGWLLHGPGGTGKSSLAKAIAQNLKIPIYFFHLGTLSDKEFTEKWKENVYAPAVILLEDFDSYFNKRENLTSHKSLTFDTVLNAISGVNSSDGIFLIVTTNHIDKIDEALGVSATGGISTRPGRIDSVIYMGEMSEQNRSKMANRILVDWPEIIPNIVKKGQGMMPAQFQELCICTAFEKINESKFND